MGPDDVTDAWMSEVLGADVGVVSRERIGDGLVGLNLRIGLDVARGRDDLPSSVVVKLPSPDETSRATGIALRNYEREVKFYERIATTVAIRVPHCWHASWEAGSGDFALVLEDMAPAEQGDQITGCTVERATAAVRELARLHGPRWDDPTLADHEFLSRSSPEQAAQLEGLWSMFVPGFMATYGPSLDDEGIALIEAFGPIIGRWASERSGPETVTHGDYRLDNLLFGTDAGGPPVTAVDWQTPGHGRPIGDLAYFCGAGLLPELRREAEGDLLDAYLAELSTFDVTVERDWAWEQYRRWAFGGIVMSVVASQVVGASDRSERMFTAMATRHVRHALDLDALDAIG